MPHAAARHRLGSLVMVKLLTDNLPASWIELTASLYRIPRTRLRLHALLHAGTGAPRRFMQRLTWPRALRTLTRCARPICSFWSRIVAGRTCARCARRCACANYARCMHAPARAPSTARSTRWRDAHYKTAGRRRRRTSPARTHAPPYTRDCGLVGTRFLCRSCRVRSYLLSFSSRLSLSLNQIVIVLFSLSFLSLSSLAVHILISPDVHRIHVWFSAPHSFALRHTTLHAAYAARRVVHRCVHTSRTARAPVTGRVCHAPRLSCRRAAGPPRRAAPRSTCHTVTGSPLCALARVSSDLDVICATYCVCGSVYTGSVPPLVCVTL